MPKLLNLNRRPINYPMNTFTMSCGYCGAPARMSIMRHAICDDCFHGIIEPSEPSQDCVHCGGDYAVIEDQGGNWCPGCWREHGVHPPTDTCPDAECTKCAVRDCPHAEPMHYHHDGCPACTR